MVLRDWFWIIGLIAADQLTKALAYFNKPYSGLFQLTMNTGAGFGILQGKNWVLLVISLVVLVLVWRPFIESKGREHGAYLMLIAGILGNSIDRIFHAAVIDFVSIGSFPIFNLADSLITISILYLVARGLRESFRSWHFHRIRRKAKK